MCPEQYISNLSGVSLILFLRSGREELSRMNESIARSTATALESERVGIEVIEDLNYQRERLDGARDRLQEANTGIGLF